MPKGKSMGRRLKAYKECSVCGSQEGPFCLERRPTGGSGTMEIWGYCKICAVQYFTTGFVLVESRPVRPEAVMDAIAIDVIAEGSKIVA